MALRFVVSASSWASSASSFRIWLLPFSALIAEVLSGLWIEIFLKSDGCMLLSQSEHSCALKVQVLGCLVNLYYSLSIAFVDLSQSDRLTCPCDCNVSRYSVPYY